MRTPDECLGKAAEMDRQADSSRVASDAAQWRAMAEHWRRLARQVTG